RELVRAGLLAAPRTAVRIVELVEQRSSCTLTLTGHAHGPSPSAVVVVVVVDVAVVEPHDHTRRRIDRRRIPTHLGPGHASAEVAWLRHGLTPEGVAWVLSIWARCARALPPRASWPLGCFTLRRIPPAWPPMDSACL